MSDAAAPTEVKTDAKVKKQKDASVNSTPTVDELIKRGFVLETTAKEPDDKIYDYYHNPYSPENPFGDPADYGEWILIPAADPSKCVNPGPYPKWPKKIGAN